MGTMTTRCFKAGIIPTSACLSGYHTRFKPVLNGDVLWCSSTPSALVLMISLNLIIRIRAELAHAKHITVWNRPENGWIWRLTQVCRLKADIPLSLRVSDAGGVGKSSVPEPRWSWSELWGKLFCADRGAARCRPKADASENRPSGYGPQKQTLKVGPADFGRAMSAYEQRRRERVRFQARVRAGSRRCQAVPGHGAGVPDETAGWGGARG